MSCTIHFPYLDFGSGNKGKVVFYLDHLRQAIGWHVHIEGTSPRYGQTYDRQQCTTLERLPLTQRLFVVQVKVKLKVDVMYCTAPNEARCATVQTRDHAITRSRVAMAIQRPVDPEQATATLQTFQRRRSY